MRRQRKRFTEIATVAVILTMSFSAIWGVSEQKAVFDVPASSYTADANTLLLLSGKQSGDMPVDSSPVNRKIIATEIGYVPGKSGQALSFNGKSSYIEIPDFRISDKDIFTVEFWIKPARKTRSKSETIFRDGTVPEQGRLSAFVDRQGHLNFIIYNEGRPSVTSKSALASGQWTHVAIVAKRNGYMRLYINGVLEDIEKVAKWSPFGSLKIGDAVAATSWFEGALDEFRISDTDRITPPAKDIINALMDEKTAKAAEEKTKLEQDGKYRKYSKDIVNATEFLSSAGCIVDKSDNSIVMNAPGAWASYPVYTPAEGHYRVMFRAFAEKGAGELLVRAFLTPVTAKNRDFGSSGSVYIPAYGDNLWHWHEINAKYSFRMTEGWSDLKIVFHGKENDKPGRLKIDSVTLTAANDYTRYEEGRFRTSLEAGHAAEMMQSLKYRMVQLEYPMFYEPDIKGTRAKERTLELIKHIIDTDLAPNGFNWINLSIYANWPRPRAKNTKLAYPSKISCLNSSVSGEEDCIPEIIAYAHAKGMKVTFYMPLIKNLPSDVVSGAGLTMPQLELEIARELVEKYRPDGLTYEGPTSNSIWQDLKKIDPNLELFLDVSDVDPFQIEKESKGNWNCITMDNLKFPAEVFPPIICFYITETIDPVAFQNYVLRTLKTPGARGFCMYFSSPYTMSEPFCSVIGTLYHGRYSKSRYVESTTVKGDE